MVKDLRAHRVPIDGVGSQADLSTRYGNFSPFQVKEMLDRCSRRRPGTTAC